MNPSLGADAILVAHLLFIFFQIFGGFLVVWRPVIAIAHVPAVAWGVWIELSHGICPLTPFENSLRHAADGGEYAGDFIGHYLTPLIYPPGLTPSIQVGLAALLFTGNALLYVWAALRYRRRNESRRAD